MRHNSISLNNPVEFIDITPLNPLISKCVIKVCYVGDDPNRNKSVITKEVAKKMANTIPGSPIVGFYNEEKEDFEAHNRELEIVDDKISFKDATRPYGFVDLNAKCWFEEFDDDGIKHEYLMTEGYLWTGQYPEATQFLEKGQSMELAEDLTDGHWTSNHECFIIDTTSLSKLCILGDDVEPCFEGASVKQLEFSFNENFIKQFTELMEIMAKYIKEGDTSMDTNVNEVEEVVETEVVEETPEVEAAEEPTPTYNLDEIPEYVNLKISYSDLQAMKEKLEDEVKNLQAQYDDIVFFKDDLSSELERIKAEYADAKSLLDALTVENTELKEYKLNIEKKEKEAMIDRFFMLSEEDKADVIANIDTYSLDEIEAKLSTIGFRKGINFSLNTEEVPNNMSLNIKNDDEPSGTYTWVDAVKNNVK